MAITMSSLHFPVWTVHKVKMNCFTRLFLRLKPIFSTISSAFICWFVFSNFDTTRYWQSLTKLKAPLAGIVQTCCCDSSCNWTSGWEHLSIASTNKSQSCSMDAERENEPDDLKAGCKNIFQEPHTVSWRDATDDTTCEQWWKSSSSGCSEDLNDSVNKLLEWSESKSSKNADDLWVCSELLLDLCCWLVAAASRLL